MLGSKNGEGLLSFAKEVFMREGIECVSALPLSACELIRPYLLEKEQINGGTVITFAVPYLMRGEEANISLYAVSRDYHLYFSELFERIIPLFADRFPEYRFKDFSDHSPINEVLAAAMSGLGVIGENGLLITEKYSSFVFLGEVITDMNFDAPVLEAKGCEGCGACRSACPVGLDKQACLSALTQKKGELSPEESELIRCNGMAWGCDICQISCPHFADASETEIKFFREKRIPFLGRCVIEKMDNAIFSERAYSWRKKETVLRNIGIFEKNN